MNCYSPKSGSIFVLLGALSFPEHPAYVTGKGWTQAGLLAAGDEIEDYDGNTPLKVISVAHEDSTERVYNFEVEGTHSYFAGDVGAWVHNGVRKWVRAVLAAIRIASGDISDPQVNPENPFENKPRIERPNRICKAPTGPKPPSFSASGSGSASFGPNPWRVGVN